MVTPPPNIIGGDRALKAGKRSQQEHLRILLERAREVEEDYLRLRRIEFFGDSPESRRNRRALRNLIYEFSDAGTNLGRAFRKANPRIDLEKADRMRSDLAHDYPTVTDEEVWAYASEYVPHIARLVQRARFSKEEKSPTFRQS